MWNKKALMLYFTIHLTKQQQLENFTWQDPTGVGVGLYVENGPKECSYYQSEAARSSDGNLLWEVDLAVNYLRLDMRC